jgi:hypothetical protein
MFMELKKITFATTNREPNYIPQNYNTKAKVKKNNFFKRNTYYQNASPTYHAMNRSKSTTP